jgi:hypothetical protein
MDTYLDWCCASRGEDWARPGVWYKGKGAEADIEEYAGGDSWNATGRKCTNTACDRSDGTTEESTQKEDPILGRNVAGQ